MQAVDAYAAALSIGVRPTRIRQWASRGKLTAIGRDWRGRTLYSLDEIHRVAEAMTRHDRQACDDGSNLSH